MSQLLNRFKLSNHQVFVLFLFIYSITAIFFHPAAWSSLLLILATGLIYFIFNQKILHHKKNFWNTLISLLIIFLTWHYSSDLNGFLLTSLVVLTTLSLKYFLQYKGCSVTNPAATGLLLVTLLNDFLHISELSFLVGSLFQRLYFFSINSCLAFIGSREVGKAPHDHYFPNTTFHSFLFPKRPRILPLHDPRRHHLFLLGHHAYRPQILSS
jgi:hypothetical protein